MAKRKQSATQKLRKLVQQQVRRMEKRGYRIESELKEKIKTGKYQTLKSIQRNRYQKLYKQSSSEIEGKIVGGEQKRTYERKESARRGLETRRYNRYIKRRDWLEQQREIEEERRKREYYQDDDYYDEDYDEEWEHERRRQDEQDRRDAQLYDEGKIAYNQINELVEQYPTPGSKMLKNALRSEISKYGEVKVLQAMGNAPSTFVETAQMIIYYEEESSAIHSALVSFIEVITGTIINGSDAREIGETMDEMTDFGSL